MANFSDMIDSISIENFKNLSGLTIPELSRINLISGKNNVGKSSLLEALGIFISDTELLEIITNRGEFHKSYQGSGNPADSDRNLEALSSIFTGREKSCDESKRITIRDAENVVTLGFQQFAQVSIPNEDGMISPRFIKIDHPDHLTNNLWQALVITRNGIVSSRLFTDKKLDSARFHDSLKQNGFKNLIVIDSTDNNDTEGASSLWDRITLTDKEQYVIEALRIIEPGIENIAFLESSAFRGRYPVVKVKGISGRIPLRSMGDGINHILSFILAIVNCEDGCVMIDEIDNGLHYSVQKQLWEIIFKISKKLNVQIFATTHSSDCISSFGKVLSADDNMAEGQYIRLEYKGNKVCATTYNPSELDIVAAQNIEIR
ncbi:ATP-binding protein [uncultured Duncaniella sp.]|uniref:AAA family ATPase n=1 Tax=uncultured Duncaniella sp. TaxID=2768039 RepID=UPI00260F5863|nr:ATP-binding protein [uncultured Duncaniella sp.]